MKLWGLEPALIIGAVMALVSLLVAFGAPITDDQKAAIGRFLDPALMVIGAWLIRRQVIPSAKVEAAHGLLGVRQAEAVTTADLVAVDAEKDAEKKAIP